MIGRYAWARECCIFSVDQNLTSFAGGSDTLDTKLKILQWHPIWVQSTVQGKVLVVWFCLPHWLSILGTPNTRILPLTLGLFCSLIPLPGVPPHPLCLLTCSSSSNPTSRKAPPRPGLVRLLGFYSHNMGHFPAECPSWAVLIYFFRWPCDSHLPSPRVCELSEGWVDGETVSALATMSPVLGPVLNKYFWKEWI